MREVFSRFPEIDRVVIYGSRAKGNYKKGSDIDLTLLGENLDQKFCSEIDDALDELLLPYMIDLSVFDLLHHQELEDHIRRIGRVFYEKS